VFDGLHRKLKQKEWYARDGPRFSESGTNAAYLSEKEATAQRTKTRGDVQMPASIQFLT
jgi:hypothetical protein